ncbi:hypothetical protein VHEMI04048 [[Torrubiella] hemipterigena]|uniref:Deoxyribose-phosphate aldolase n=1 Tax=[Torrubiella] hemipterigena TaxID=1531966 RepID=A0A0A1T080_9HYPO|nr:hypothetical protein VHEMI04048 [[Torrubiella] hemipterigena]
MSPPRLSRKRKASIHPPPIPPSSILPPPFNPIPNGRPWTISIAIPSSIIADLHAEAQSYTIARIARSLAIFSIDEAIVFADCPASADHVDTIAALLAYLDCPPFMRKHLFPPIADAESLPALDAPHHPHPKDPWIPYREAIAISTDPATSTTVVDAALDETLSVPGIFPPSTRLTLHFADPDSAPSTVHPDVPRSKGGYYWGYSVRRSPSLSAIFTSGTDNYDLCVGISPQGATPAEAFPAEERGRRSGAPRFRRMLVVIGGDGGLETAANNDERLRSIGIEGEKTGELFDRLVSVLPGQGSRAVSADELVYIALAALKNVWDI